MEQAKYVVVEMDVLPDVIEKVLRVKEQIADGKAKGVSDAVKQQGISRSAYYKYKDKVFALSESYMGKKAVFAMTLKDQPGLLADTLNVFSASGANILSINQSIPIDSKANVNISVDVTHVEEGVDALVEKLKAVKGITGVKLLAMER